ncbi:hypothetical protein D9M71_569320 [compost metagenome]
MLVAERRELVDRAAQVEGARGFEGRHQHAFFRGEDFCRLAHEAYAGNDHRLGRMVLAEASHFQRVGHATAGLFGQRLDDRVAIVMGDQNGVLGLELGSDGRTVVGLLLGCQRIGLFGVEVSLNQQAFGNLGHDRWTCGRACASNRVYHPALTDRLVVPDGTQAVSALCGRGLLSDAEGYRESREFKSAFCAACSGPSRVHPWRADRERISLVATARQDARRGAWQTPPQSSSCR